MSEFSFKKVLRELLKALVLFTGAMVWLYLMTYVLALSTIPLFSQFPKLEQLIVYALVVIWVAIFLQCMNWLDKQLHNK